MIRVKEFDDILGSVLNMSLEQLNRLSRAIDASKQFAAVEPASDELLLYICSYCKKHRLDFRPPADLRKSKHYRLFMEKHADQLTYLSSFCKTKLEREAVCHLIFDDLRASKAIPMNCVGLMHAIHLIPGTIENMFPGYDDMGLLPLIARRLAAS